MKQRVTATVFPMPMPTVLVGTTSRGQVNFQATAFIGFFNSAPVIIGIGVNKQHLTAEGIAEHDTFSVNIPNQGLVVETDYCGIRSGRQVDKGRFFTVFTGELPSAPMIEECPVTMECQVVAQLDFGRAKGYFGEVQGVYADPAVLSQGIPDLGKMEPFLYSRPDHRYWRLGNEFAKAHSVGRQLDP